MAERSHNYETISELRDRIKVEVKSLSIGLENSCCNYGEDVMHPANLMCYVTREQSQLTTVSRFRYLRALARESVGKGHAELAFTANFILRLLMMADTAREFDLIASSIGSTTGVADDEDLGFEWKSSEKNKEKDERKHRASERRFG